jgi:RHS repeat-associated protein
LLDGLYVICEFSDSGDVLREYVPGVSVSIGGSVYYYHYDRLGSVRFMSDEEGNVVQEYVYDGWGNLVSSSGSVSQPYQYLSFYSEGEIGLYLTGKRWYAPDIGRYISRNSPYLFSNNNPVSPLPVYTPPISDITTPDNPKDPLGFYFHGNWCGPGWSSGRFTDNPEEVDWSVPAIDSIDQCCKFHDWCVQHENNWWDRWVGECRNLICSCLKNNIDPCDLKKHPGLRILLDILQKIFLCENPGLPF